MENLGNTITVFKTLNDLCKYHRDASENGIAVMHV